MSVSAPAEVSAEEQLLLHFTRSGFFPDSPVKVGVAVSGGSDSMALLQLYVQLSQLEGLHVEAVTIDHGLRDAAQAEAQHVAQFCNLNGIHHDVVRWSDWDGRGNTMAAARDARYRLIAEWAKSRGMDGVALGHTADDQAENFLIRLARKSGPDGLAQMAPRFFRHGIRWARPLWQQSRAELRSYLRRHGVDWVEDPSNDDGQFERSRARKVLQHLNGLGIGADALTSVSVAMRSTSNALTHYARLEARQCVAQERGDLVLTVEPAHAPPDEIVRRIWRNMLPWVSGRPYPPKHRALFETIYGLTPDGNQTVGGCLISRKGHQWRVTRELQAVRNLTVATTEIWDGRWVLDGPHAPDLQIRALGEGIRDCPDWRSMGLPRPSLVATPAVWRGDVLIAAPLAGLENGWVAQIVTDFHSAAFAH